MKMDQRGQISIEFVLIIAFMLILVLVFAGYIGDAMELNSVSAAARYGATNTISDLVFLNRSVEPFRVTDVQILGSGQNLTIQINVDKTLQPAANLTIFNGALHSVANLGYTIDVRTLDPYDDVVVSNRHQYSITIV
ncbi:MAG: hypothetical protein HZC47_07625 [Methanobacterium sp.]|uniref:TadE/TadG family type IV pilus assembly protein n=1 Tax=Methanobacterium sp. TaxID=2164 RepID=UPI003D66225C|nr:hypothetical protein [Methanobacterium sp.]